MIRKRSAMSNKKLGRSKDLDRSKIGEISAEGFPLYLDLCHPGGRWPLMAPTDDVLDGFLPPLKDRLDLTRGEITDPTCKALAAGLLFGVHPEAHALDAAGDQNMRSGLGHKLF